MINIPTQDDVVKQVTADIQTETGITDLTTIQTGFFAGFISSLAQLVYVWYKNLKEEVIIKGILLNAMVGSDLDKFGINYCGIARNLATRSSGNAIIQGALNTVIPAGTLFTVINSGQYKTTIAQQILTTTINNAVFTASANTVTVTTIAPHNLASNVLINVAGCVNTDFNVVNSAITVISANIFTYQINNTQNATQTTGGVITIDMAILPVQSVSTGSITNLSSGASLNILGAIQNLNLIAYVDFYGISGGTDKETDKSYRSRLKYKIQNNTQYYTETGMPQYLMKEYPAITRVKLVRNYERKLQIKSITNFIDSTNVTHPNIKVLEFYQKHEITEPEPIHQITGSAVPLLNQTGGMAEVINEYKLKIVNSTTTQDDTTSQNMQCLFYSYGINCILFMKDNDINKYPNPQEIKDVKKKLISLLFTATDNTVQVKAPTKIRLEFTLSTIAPDSPSMRDSIKNNLVDYMKIGKQIGEGLLDSEYNSILYNTIDANGNKLKSFALTLKANGTQTTNVTCAFDEVIDLVPADVTF